MLVDRPTTLEIDANLETLRMKTSRPIEGLGTFKVMPFHTDPFSGQAAKQRPPLPFNASPNRLLAKLLPVQHATYVLRINLNNKAKIDCCANLFQGDLRLARFLGDAIF
jgi:hypothetical protein